MKVRATTLISSLPAEWPASLLPEIAASVQTSRKKIVVLDDDPTGTQTVYGVPVLTEWSEASLTELFREPGVVVYILTNSRSLTAESARELNREVAYNLLAAARTVGREFVVISRSDSTLRGHYPDEVDALVEGLGQSNDGTLIVPFFLEGGRFTIGDTHYVQEKEWLVPAAETEYARDAAFGYRSSDLRQWVSEKLRGRISSDDVQSISIEEQRRGGPTVVARRLEKLIGGQVCIVNAASYRDLEVFVTGLLKAEAEGKRFVYRTAASFVRVRCGLEPRALMRSQELQHFRPKGLHKGGLVIAGSYTQKSSAQIAVARDLPNVCSLEVEVENLLNSRNRDAEIQRVAATANAALICRKDVIVFTSRRLAVGDGDNGNLHIGQRISDSLVSIVQCITEQPAWIIAKGGITSSDIASKSLGVKRAEVLGQVLPGVPIWLTGRESRWPNQLYAVFPGNVGETNALAEIIQILRNGCRG